MMRRAFGSLFWAACALGRPIGGLRPRRIYRWLAGRAFDADHVELRWHRNRWGSELLLSPYYTIDREIIAFGCYDVDLHEYLERALRPGMFCLDVGSNLGEVALHMAARVGREGRVIAFEPVKQVRERLEAHVRRNGYEAVISVRPEALLDRESVAMMRTASDRGENQGMASIIDPENPYLTGVLEVPTLTLDGLMAELDLPRLDLIKVDIQGAEPRMLRGAEKTLDRFSPDLLMEISPAELRYDGLTSRDLIAQLESLGYRAFSLRRGRAHRRVLAKDVPEWYFAPNLLFTKAP